MGAIIVISIAVILLFAFLPKMIEQYQIMAKARADYTRSRGTYHVRQIRAAIRKHESALHAYIQESNRLTQELDVLGKEQTKEFKMALMMQLVNDLPLEVPGIGTKLKDRIIATCFDGSLESLLRSQYVPGIGEQRAHAIRVWVRDLQKQMPQLLASDFVGKRDILAKYGKKRREMFSRKEKIAKIMEARQKLISYARHELEPLEAVTPLVFARALRGNSKASDAVARYTIGAFAEWEPLPMWFSDIMKDPVEGK